MKKLYFITMVCAAAMFVSCGKKAVLENSIPKDAMMVMRFDVKSMIAKADYNLFKNEKIKKNFDKMKDEFDNDAQKKIFENFVKNPNSFGIDIIGDAYFFMNKQQVNGFLFAVNDAKKVCENLKTFEFVKPESITQENGVYSIKTGVYDIIWDNSKMLILFNSLYGLDEYTQEEEEVDYFNLPLEKSIVSDVNFQKFAATKGDITTYYAFENYASYMEKFTKQFEKEAIEIENDESQTEIEKIAKLNELLKKVTEIYENFDGISAVFNCNFEKGKIVSKMQMLYATKEAEQKYDELYDYSNAKLTGEFFKYIPQNPLFLIAMDFDGEKALAVLEKFGIPALIDEMLAEKLDEKANIFDYKALISSIKGDMMFSVNNVKYENYDVAASMSAFVKLNNTDVVQSLLNTLNENNINEFFNANFDKFALGLQDDFFYFVTNSAKDAFETGEANALTNKIKEQPMLIYGDLSSLKESISPLYAENFQLKMFSSLFDKGLTLVETYESKYIDKNNIEIIVNFTDKRQNSLKQFFGFIDEVISAIQ